MNTIVRTGYCPHCQQNVLLTRENIDWPLAIILLIFTAGIGLIIYLIIYFSKLENRCVHCNSIVHSINIQERSEDKILLIKQNHQDLTRSNQLTESNQEIKTSRYCPYCGEKMNEINAQFCSNCGTRL
jgi:NADH pyrophosphatase NudC (nudix superfamily)